MRGETMKDKSKKSTYSTTFGVDPKNKANGQAEIKSYARIYGVKLLAGKRSRQK